MTCYGIDPTPFECRVLNPEKPGEYCFPPLASLITAAARLMLAVLECCVTDLGGTYAMEDTDSMAIVATQRGGLIECPGGADRKRGKPAIRALSWAQVDAIARRFERLNPYDRAVIPGSVLKIEDDNFDPSTGRQRQLCCLAISAKRYALFLRDRKGEPALLREGINNKEDRYSEHGLGHLLNPTDPQSEDRSWIAQAWLAIVRRSLGLPTKPLGFEKRVAVGRITVSSPAVMKPLKALNDGKPYAKQIKPFNFIISCHVRKLGHPIGADPERFHLIAPYETDPRQWEAMQVDRSVLEARQAIPDQCFGAARIADRWCASKATATCCASTSTIPRPSAPIPAVLRAASKPLGYLGGGILRSTASPISARNRTSWRRSKNKASSIPSDVYTEYPDPLRDEWKTKWLPILKAMPISELMKRSGLSRRALYMIRAGRRPQPENATNLKSIAREQGK